MSAFTRPSSSSSLTTMMAGSTMYSSTSLMPIPPILPQTSQGDRGKAIMTDTTVEPAIVAAGEHNFLSESRKRRLADSLIVIFPGVFEGDDPTTAQEFQGALRRIENMLNRALKHGHYFGVKPWNSAPPPHSPAIEFDYGLNPRSVLFPMYTPSKSLIEGTEPYDNVLLLWYATNAQGIKKTFSLSRIIKINEVESDEAFQGMITNFKITVTRADTSKLTFILADLLFTNLADIATLICLCTKREDLSQMRWLVNYFSRFLELLFRDYAHQDRELGKAMRFEVERPRNAYTGNDVRANGEIITTGEYIHGIYFELDNRYGTSDRRIMRLEEDGLYLTTRINDITGIVPTCPKKAKKKTENTVLNRLTWIVEWRSHMLKLSNAFFPNVYMEVEILENEERRARLEGASGGGAGGAGGPIMFSDDS